MNESQLSENYRLRKYFLSTDEVPSQSLMKKKMSEPLAALYFKSMTLKLKIVAGLEPPMKGGGRDWYVPPKDLLKGRTVLRPIKKDLLARFNYIGVDAICMKMVANQHNNMLLEMNKSISENDEKWKRKIEEKCEQIFNDHSLKAAEMNSEELQKEFKEFSIIYARSLNNIEALILDAASSEIKRTQNEAQQKMKDKYKTLLKHQATELYDTFIHKLMIENVRLRGEFLETLTNNREEIREKIHDLRLETHQIIQKIRRFWECQRMACQVYVTLKEKEECKKDVMLSEHLHKKKMRTLEDEIVMKDNEITDRTRIEKIQFEFDAVWQKKVWYIIKHFEMYVSYCLHLVPEYADFFINLEKLMLVHMNDVLEHPSAENTFEKERYEGPIADPHPFYIFCDKNQKIRDLALERHLCPKRCTSDASQMPVIVVNKRCMYAACDNFEQFNNKVKHYINGERGDDEDIVDDHVYEYDVPVKYTTSQQLLELKLESSLLQVLNQELSNIREKPVVCEGCKVPYCFCTSQVTERKIDTQGPVSHLRSGGKKLVTSKMDCDCEQHATGIFLKSIHRKPCTCSKTAKKHLVEHLPAYMRPPSFFKAASNMPSYGICSLDTLKRLFREARTDVVPIDKDKTRDVATQCIDVQFDTLCTCFSEDIDDLKAKSAELLQKLYQPVSKPGYFDSSITFSSLCDDPEEIFKIVNSVRQD